MQIQSIMAKISASAAKVLAGMDFHLLHDLGLMGIFGQECLRA